MDPKTILTILAVVESVGKVTLDMYQQIQEMKGADPNTIDLQHELELQKHLEDIINVRMKIRQELIDAQNIA